MSLNFDFGYNVFRSDINSGDSDVILNPITPVISPALKIEKAFSILRTTMDDCLYGRAKPAFYVMRAACGSGKTSEIQKYLRNWKAAGFPGDGSALVMLPTLVDIDAYLAGCGLDRGDYACYTSDPCYNAYGLGRDKAGEAKVLFTMQEQVRLRTGEVDGFSEAGCFYYKGARRTLRIWEESLLFSHHVSIRIDAICSLLTDIRIIAPQLATALDAFLPDKTERVEGAILSVPASFADLINRIGSERRARLGRSQKTVLEELSKVAGGIVVLKSDARGWIVIGAGRSLPRDLAPMIVVDASARMRKSYDIRNRFDGDIIWLPEVDIDYKKMEINFWNKGCGKEVLGYPDERSIILNPVVDLINAKASERWLIIHPKAVLPSATTHGFDLEAEITKRLAQESKVSFCHYGRHLSTNDHRDIRNVIILGGLNYGKHSYEAMYLAAAGRHIEAVDSADRHEVENGEFQHNAYQAICRGNARNTVDGVGGECTVYFVAPDRGKKKALLQEAFPHCTINAWEPVPRATSKVELVMATIERLLDEEGPRIPIKAVWSALGAKSSSYLTKEWKKTEMVQFMRRNSIRRDRKTLFVSNVIKGIV